MDTTLPRQGDLQLRLVQWLLDQLNSPGELETVTQQLSSLISRAQDQTISNLYASIGMLMFQKVTHIRPGELRSSIRLCAELCYSLFMAHLNQHSELVIRVVLIHEHIYQQCIDSLTTGDIRVVATSTGPSPELLQNGDRISVESGSELLFYLYDFRLVSLAQVCEYVFRVVKSHKSSTGARLIDAVAGVRLLSGLFTENSPVPWKDKAEPFNEWVRVHSSPNEGQSQTITNNDTQIDGPEIVTEEEGDKIERKDSPSLKNESDDSAPPNKTSHSSHVQVHDEQVMHNMVGNNAGKPPSTPVSSRAESPVENNSEGQVPTGFLSGAKYGPTGSSEVAADPIAATAKGMDGSDGVLQAGTTSGIPTNQLAPTTSSDSASSGPTTGLSNRSPTQIAPSCPPRATPISSFREYVTREKQRLAQKKQAIVQSEKEKRMAELVAFSQNFKLNKPIPKDLASIITKETEKSSRDVATVKARQIGSSSPSIVPDRSSSLFTSTIVPGGAPTRSLSTSVNDQRAPANQTEPVDYAPLERNANAWVAYSIQRNPKQAEKGQLVDRKVKALLNKLTMETFDSISDQVIEWANKSEQEKDGSTLMQVIKLVFGKAKDEAMFSEMYARLCRKMMERVSPNIQDETIRNSEGQPIVGGMLFRKYLVNRCQEDFERGWSAKEAALAAGATKVGEDKAAEEASEDNDKGIRYSDEYYAAAKARRQGLGLVRFIGELFKQQMLTERIMHECIKELLSNAVNPKEEEIESLCELLTTVGQSLDNPKVRAHMDIYFERMQDMAKSSNININAQMRRLLLDVVELRARHWQTRTAASRSSPAHQGSSYDGGRHGATRGGSRGGSVTEPDGWNVAGGTGATRPAARAGDLSQFGKSSKPTGLQFGPSSVFRKRDANKRDSSIGGANGTNMFSYTNTPY